MKIEIEAFIETYIMTILYSSSLHFWKCRGGRGEVLSCRTVALGWSPLLVFNWLFPCNAAYGPGSGIYMYKCACSIQLEEDRIVHVGKKVCKDGVIYILVDWTFWCILTLSAFVIYANRYSSAYTPILHMYTYRYKLIHVWFLQSMPVGFFFI